MHVTHDASTAIAILLLYEQATPHKRPPIACEACAR